MDLLLLITIGISLVLIAGCSYILGYDAHEKKKSNYSEMDIFTADYLAKRQAVNENYLQIQKALLELFSKTRK